MDDSFDVSKVDDIVARAFPVSGLVIYFNRAINDKHWLEAIVLAHMYIETQLRTVLGKEIRKQRNTSESVITLAKKAKEKKKIEEGLFERIEDFNTIRNNAVHHLSIGIISYEELEKPARQAGNMMNELLSLHAYKPFEPEQGDESSKDA